MDYSIHDVANLFPMMSDEEFKSLVEDIKENGQREPITLYKNQIIDGRNRYTACVQLGIDPIVREWDGKGSLVSTVISLNLKRRHLTSAQKAAVAVDMLPLLEAEAKERQKQAGITHGRSKEKVTQKIGEAIENPKHDGEATEQAAKLMGTNRQYVSDTKKIKQEAPEVFERVKSGEFNLITAKTLASVSGEVREKALNNLSEREEGKTSVCLYCGELKPLDEFELRSGTSKCKACRNKEISAKKKVESETSKIEIIDPQNAVKHLLKRIKELEIRNKELQKELDDERRQHMVDVDQLQSEIFVIKGNLTRSGIDYENLKQTIS